jgi:hypothetical protein
MSKTKETAVRVNKSEKVREYLEANPEASVTDIVAALEPFEVTKANVYQVKNSQKNKVAQAQLCQEAEAETVDPERRKIRVGSKKIRATPVNETIDVRDITVADLQKVASVRDSVGGMRNLKKVISTLETLNT